MSRLDVRYAAVHLEVTDADNENTSVAGILRKCLEVTNVDGEDRGAADIQEIFANAEVDYD